MLKLNIGFAKKIGEPNYSSRGASVNLELEAEASLVNQPAELQQRIRELFQLAKASVHEELSCQHRLVHDHDQNENAQLGKGQRGKGQHENGQHGNVAAESPVRRATPPQCRVIRSIADQHRVDLEQLLRDRFHTESLENLTLSQASTLIDDLKVNGNGTAAGE